nr:uncharacterized protein LOC111513821 [Leptinotarsa decemlineata]
MMWGEESEICSIGMTMHPSGSASSGISQLAQCGQPDELPELPAPDEQRLQKAAIHLQQRLVLRQWLSKHTLQTYYPKLLAIEVTGLEDVYWLEDGKAKQVFNKDFPRWSTARQSLPISKQRLEVLKADLWSEVVKSSNHQDAWTWGGMLVVSVSVAGLVTLAAMTQPSLAPEAKHSLLQYVTGKYLLPSNCKVNFIVPIGVPCIVFNNTYVHGETFSLDCRTQCACQNGTYGCSSLCPQEHISPRGSCQHPRLVEIPGQCCREWMCDSQTAEHPPSCQPAFSRWSTCSRECGSGLSTRRSNLNPRCHPDTETRICQIRRCLEPLQLDHHEKYHHLRRGHECKATHRLSSAVFLRFGPCRSRKRFRPKYCGVCPVPGISCKPTLSTTVKVEFFCEGSEPNENVSDLLPEYLEPGADLWADNFLPDQDVSEDSRLMTVLVQWVLKCQCTPEESAATSSTGEVILHRVHRTATP